MDLILTLLFEVFGEILFGLAWQVIAYIVGVPVTHALGKRGPLNPWAVLAAYALFGAALAGVSLWPFPDSLLRPTWARAANLLLTPVLAGLAMAALGHLRLKHKAAPGPLENFAAGFAFAWAFAALRFAFAR